MNGPSSLASPAQLLQLLQQQGAAGPGEGAPPVQELLEGARRLQAGAAPPPAADQVEVFPEPGFVIKTANEQGQKVFINVCGSTKLPLPSGWTKGQVPPEVRQHLEAGLGGEAPVSMLVPLTLGQPRIEADHRGAPCLVADCILNSEMLERAAEYRPLKIFLIQLVMAHTAQQVGLELDPQYKLPKMRYKGGMPPPQFIRVQGQPGSSGGSSGSGAGPVAAAGEAAPAVTAADQAGPGGSGKAGGSSKPLIAEVGSDGEEAPAFALLASKRQARQRQAGVLRQQAVSDAASEKQQASAQPLQQTAAQQPAAPVQLHPQIEYVGKPATEVHIRLQLPAAVAAAVQQDPEAISTGVCAETVRVEAPGCDPLDVRLPFAVSAAGGSAELQAAAASGGSGGSDSGSSGAQLVLRLPYLPISSVLQELRQAAGAAEGQTSGGGGSMMDLD